jgi:hypothetical protein
VLSYRRAVEFAKEDPEIARHFAKHLGQLEQRVPEVNAIEAKPMRADARWIWENRLALNPCVLCRELFVVLNTIIATYGTARWQFWMAEDETNALAVDHIIQHTGASAPLVDLGTGLRMAALTSFYRVLGQIASALNNFFCLKHPPNRVAFENVWGMPRSQGLPKTPKQLHPGIRRRRNAPLCALYYLAASLEIGLGRYQDLRILRNRIEHRLAAPVLNGKPKYATHYYETFIDRDLSGNVYKLARIAKAAIWYFAAALSVEEHRRVLRVQRRGHAVLRGTRTSVVRR